jgi:hypothetical protein
MFATTNLGASRFKRPTKQLAFRGNQARHDLLDCYHITNQVVGLANNPMSFFVFGFVEYNLIVKERCRVSTACQRLDFGVT